MSIQIQERDKVSRAAAAESIGPAARRVIAAVAASTEGLQAVAARPSDPRAAFAALVQMRQSQATIDAAVGEYLAWLRLAGVTRSAMAVGLGVRPATVARMLAPAEHIASARGCDLHRGDDGTWIIRRVSAGGAQ